MRSYLEDFREHWNDPYWWHDHWVEQTILIVVLYGTGSIFFHYLDTKLLPTP